MHCTSLATEVLAMASVSLVKCENQKCKSSNIRKKYILSMMCELGKQNWGSPHQNMSDSRA